MKLLTASARLAMLTGVIATAGLACSGKILPYAGGLMIAVQTDLVAPKDVAAIGLFISSDGKPIFGDTREVAPNGEVKFPATIAVLGDENRPKAVVKVRVVAFGRDGKVRVMRDALTTVPRRRTGLLRTPLLWVNEGSGTGSRSDLVQSASIRILDAVSDGFTKLKSTCPGTDQTTIDDACVDEHIDGESLPDYHDADVFGGGTADGFGGTCFDVKACFESSAPIVLDDMTGCTTTLRDGRDPNDPKLSFAVALREDPAGAASSTGECLGNGSCLIPLDKGTSWTLQGSTIRFTPGLCKRMRGAGALVQGLVASFGCASKIDSTPACGPASAVGPGRSSLPDGGIIPPIKVGDFELPDTALSEFAPNAVIALGTEILLARAGATTPTVQYPGVRGLTYPAGSGAPANVSHWSPMPPAATPVYAMAVRPGAGHVLVTDSANSALIDCPISVGSPWVCNEIQLSPGGGLAVTASSTRAYVSTAGPTPGFPLSVYDFMSPTMKLLANPSLPAGKASALASASGGTDGFVFVGYNDGRLYRCDAPCEMTNNTVPLVPPQSTIEPILAMAILEDAANSRNWIFWLQASGLFRLENPYVLDPTKAPIQLATTTELAARPALAVDSRYVYWGSPGAVSYRPQGAADAKAELGSLASDATPIVGITTTPTRVHWATQGGARTNGSVFSARKKVPF